MEAALTRSGQRGASRDLIIADGRPTDAPRREVRFAPIDGLIYWMPVAGFSGVDHALASLRESNLTLAIMSHASALTIVASKSFARRRLRLSQAMVRSTIQRRGNNLKPLAASFV